ncbi:hypothetical protein BN3087_220023 [Sulfurovum sp. enrichment culture clone C5]|uniref:Uncharacterized protein n=1 Tax=Sulfurovum sp. enrichment culture clone C5 TaxID=497650 RepID=A0A0S4XN62_9BACT|nr:hypothetical protein BN3087_220023 [Sulfurovum sp. enrichment culture clone C5]
MKIEITEKEVVMEGTHKQFEAAAFMLLSLVVKNNPLSYAKTIDFLKTVLPVTMAMPLDDKDIVVPYIKIIRGEK